MRFQAAITGVGMYTVLGPTARQTWDALLAGRSIGSDGQIPGAPEKDRARFFARQAAQEAITQARWEWDVLADESTALVFATSKGPVRSWLGPDPHVWAGRAVGYGLGIVEARVATDLGLGIGPRLNLSAACTSGLHAVVRAALMLAGGEAKRVIVIAAEAALHPLFIGSFQRLGVLAPDGFGCRPFDRRRRGFILSEGAAAICIEPADSTRAPCLAMIENAAIGSDATNLTSSDPTGKTLRHLLTQVIDAKQVDFLHAHGTATDQNDSIELAALESVLSHPSCRPQDHPPIYSHKAALGHTQGPAGLISIAINSLAHQSQMIPGNIHTRDPEPTKKLVIPTTAQKLDIHRSIAIASGFGGPVGVVSLVSP